MRNHTNSKGFSLIELMIVIAIIGILAAIAIPSYKTYVLKSKTAALLNAVQAGQTAINEHVASTGDLSCNNMSNYTQGVSWNAYQPTVAWIGYGNWDTDICYSEANAPFDEFGGNFFFIYRSTAAADGALTWQCYVMTDMDSDIVFAISPNGCIIEPY